MTPATVRITASEQSAGIACLARPWHNQLLRVAWRTRSAKVYWKSDDTRRLASYGRCFLTLAGATLCLVRPAPGQTQHKAAIGVSKMLELPEVVSPELGTVRAAVAPNGDAYIVDVTHGELHGYHANGALKNTSASRGPLRELTAPFAISADDSSVAVLPSEGSRLVIFQDSAAVLRVVRAIPLRYHGTSVCALNGRYFVLGFDPSGIVHEYARTGLAIRSFGLPLLIGGDLLQHAVTRGFMACDPRTGHVLILPVLLPEMRVYDTTGTLLWRRSVPEYRSTIIQEAENAQTLSMTRPPGGYSAAESLVLVAPGTAIVQTRNHPERYVLGPVETRLVWLPLAQVESVSASWPIVIASNGEIAVVATPEEPAHFGVARVQRDSVH